MKSQKVSRIAALIFKKATELRTDDLVKIVDDSWKHGYPTFMKNVEYGIVDSFGMSSSTKLTGAIDVNLLDRYGKFFGHRVGFTPEQLKLVTHKSGYEIERDKMFNRKIINPVFN
jgi:hypothetical protein